MENGTVSRILREMADLSEIRGDNAFRVRALRNAAETIDALPFDLAHLCDEPERLREIKGIGEGIAKKILEIRETGVCREHAELAGEIPPTLLELLQIEGVGPKKVKLFREALGVSTVADLEAAAREGKVRSLPRMSAALEEKLLKAIADHRARSGRVLLSWAEAYATEIARALEAVPGVSRVAPAGSYRRRRDTVGDLDLLVACVDAAPVMDRFVRLGEAMSHGETRSSIRLPNGLQADLRIVAEESFGAALQYFTGSKAHNVAIRGMAQKKGLTLNEYGVFRIAPDGSAGERLAGATEEEVYAALGLPWIPPELREERGEIEAALQGRLPRLVEPGDIRGDLHMHTTETDGSATIEEMALAAAALGRGYVAIADHSRALSMVRGMDEARLRRQGEEIVRANTRLRGRIRVLRGIEVDILKDGSLDMADDALGELDVVVASVHSSFGMPRDEMTARVIRAIESGLVDVIAHPTGRLLLRREPYALDLEAVLRAAKGRGVAMELNAFPDRLDLSDTHLRMAKEMGVKIVISTDAHTPEHLELLRFGVDTARRGWLEARDVLNTRGVDEFLGLLHEGHR